MQSFIILTFNETVLLSMIEESISVLKKQHGVDIKWTEIQFDDKQHKTSVRCEVTQSKESVCTS